MKKTLITVPALVALALGASAPAQAVEIKGFPGVGRAVAEKSMFSQARENEKAMDRAQALAVVDAMRDAMSELLGAGYVESEKMNATIQDLADHNSVFVKEVQVKDSSMDGLNAKVQVIVRCDLGQMKAYLKRQGISLTKGLNSKFKFVVLSYTVEQMDANLNKPIVLHEEIRADSSSSQSASFANTDNASSNYQADSAVDANRSVQAERSVQAAHVGPWSSGAVDAHAAVNANASLSARSSVGASSDRSSSAQGASASAATASYYKVVDYADPTKMSNVGATSTNQVRTLLEGALQRADLKLATVESPLVGLTFTAEDEFVNKVLKEVRRHAEIRDEDCVTIALNCLTPIDTNGRGFKYNSVVTLRYVRVGDGTNVMPSDSISKASGYSNSAGDARTQAIGLCVATLKDQLPEQVRTLMQDLNAAEAQPAAPTGQYLVEISNVQDRSVLVPFKQWLRQQGFQFKSESRAGGTVETLTLTLGDKSPEEIKDVLDGAPKSFELLGKTDTGAKLKVR